MADISIQEFQFTKDWNNPTDFPTFQSNEEQVRADQQELHNQTRDFINDVLLGAVKKAIAENQEYVENAVAEAVLGIVPDKSIGFIKLACAALELLESDTEKLPTSAAVAAYIKDALSSYMDSEAVKKYVDENGGNAPHEQSASSITSGAFAGEVFSGEAFQTEDKYLLRNSKLSLVEETPTVDGEICWYCE